MQAALADWRTGRTSWESWGESTWRARDLFAGIVGVPPGRVATGASAAELVGLVAASVPERARVLAPEREFTSLLWPFLVRGCELRTVPAAGLAEAIDSGTDVVAFSAVQSSGGEVAELEAIGAAAAAHGALSVVDATQGAGWLPLDASLFDAVVVSGYKWLLSPRGTAYLSLSEALLDRVPALHANWWAGEDPHDSYYGAPLRLAPGARRLDTSPAWFSWIAAEQCLRVLAEIGIDAIHAHDVALANRFRAGLGLPPGDSAIVSAEVPGATERLAAAGIMAATRAGSLRASFHVYNGEADVDAALDALVG
jgi:selenocysteine lyase/cysteine desulfurase